ncbi:MAG: YeeE/YedE family protein, partial [Magnetococcales bacterium]|nr:YeeE/YedE family protein [Magnetococcales bacterium]
TWGMTPVQPTPSRRTPLKYFNYIYPLLGLVTLLSALTIAVIWLESGQKGLVGRGTLVLCGVALGFVLHRSRFCFSKAFREPLVNGDGEQTRAVMLSLMLGMLSFSLVFQKELIDPFRAVPPTFWLGSLAGGVIFGIGMLLAGGCASGSLWRAAEGQVKLIIALIFFAWGGSTFSALIKQAGWLTREMNMDLLEETALGFQAFMPQILDGWTWTYLVNFSLLALWYLIIKYNEVSHRFTVM